MSGPFYSMKGDVNSGAFRATTSYRQGKPWRPTQRYVLLDYKQTLSYDMTISAGGHQLAINNTLDKPVAEASSRCRAKLDGKIANAAEMAVALIERRQSISMIVKRVTQLRKAVRQLRKFDFVGAAKTFGVTKPKGVSRKKQFADNWLEFHFGWKPMIQDIGKVVEILQGPIPHRKVRANGRSRQDIYSGSWFVELNWPNPMTKQWISGDANVYAGCRIVGVNPDLYLANQLGFVNPASVAWESVPFSFVVDWFANVGDVLASMSALVGVELADSWTTVLHKGHNTQISFQWAPLGNATSTGEGFRMERSIGLPSIAFEIKPFKGFSVTRGLTAISLLVQQLKG